MQDNGDSHSMLDHPSRLHSNMEIRNWLKQPNSSHGKLKGKANQVGTEEEHWIITYSSKHNVIRRELVSHGRTNHPSTEAGGIGMPLFDEHHQDPPRDEEEEELT